MAERMIEVGDVQLCAEAFGDPADPAVLLVMGLGASMLWWDEALCRSLADAGRFVIRYDHRDTGLSTAYPPGRPGYFGGHLADDAIAVLDAHDILAAHVVGVSAGGGVAQLLALDHPDRVRSLVLISSSPATPGDRDLPAPTPAFRTLAATASVDWADPASVVAYQLEFTRVLAGQDRPFDEAYHRELVERDVARARDPAALQNHDLLDGGRSGHPPLTTIAVPTLVVHGTADPMFPPGHGEALAGAIPGARLLLLDGMGHGVVPADHDALATAILAHTAPGPPE